MQEKSENGQASKRNRWHRLGCWIWFRIIMLLITVSLLIAYGVEVFRCGYYKPTGDALYDRYATAVISRQKWLLFHGTKHHPTYLPDSLLAEWENEFGSDPRYWQLRYFCAKNKGGVMSGALTSLGMPQTFRMQQRILFGFRTWDKEPTQLEDDAWHHLKTGVEKGVADWTTLDTLGRETNRQRSDAEDDAMDTLDDLGLDWAELRQRKIELNRKNEEAELDQHNAIIEADPVQAWPYFWRAKYWFMYGESELALADLRAGNAAPKNEMSKPFPVVFLLDRMNNGDHLGNDILAGAILEGDSYSALPNWIKWKVIFKEALGMVALGGDTEMLQELHLAACKLGLAEHTSAIELSVAATLESMLSDTLLVEYGEDLSYRERRTMKSMNSYAKSVHIHWAGYYDMCWSFTRNYPRLGISGMLMNTIGSAGSGASIDPPDNNFFHSEKFWQHFKPRLYYNRALWLQKQQQTNIIEVQETFEQLEHLDLNTLEWPYEWGNPY